MKRTRIWRYWNNKYRTKTYEIKKLRQPSFFPEVFDDVSYWDWGNMDDYEDWMDLTAYEFYRWREFSETKE